MVVSSACMMTARMTQAVIAPRLATRGAGEEAALAMAFDDIAFPILVADLFQEFRGKFRQAADVAGIDVDLGAHADPKWRLAGGVFDAHPHRDALHDLHPVAGGV